MEMYGTSCFMGWEPDWSRRELAWREASSSLSKTFTSFSSSSSEELRSPNMAARENVS
ncbi:hypothetical protein DPMN_112171 [Dreissena polymorpha]|uniref:Uncharacterized protein n=1 Tax=Dreissena polymorpha TaxID=45954 RepID=A0A9D4QPH8_DREPO|nr:hypothetical protein DPMN_112171 [Dreissena polymorpha]